MNAFHQGQRWVSESEPELGLGTVLEVSPGRVQILFPASGEMRQYVADNAPLRRVRFREGDRVETHEGESFTVTRVEETEKQLIYHGASHACPESVLSDRLNVHGPEDRLFAGQFDDAATFGLRCRTLELQAEVRRSEVRGFVGGRIDLIPHQLYVAHEVSSRFAPRVLLSDEVGLGKTIEAGLILHRYLLSGRGSRVLVVVPESLVHQWFVELLRRFHLWFNIYDEERCAAIEANQPETNPFLDDQLILCSLAFLSANAARGRQAVEAGWDVLVLDEAHHLQWGPECVSPEYALAEALSRSAQGLLLLTATPEQLGPESHFARLRLLDPERYDDYAVYQQADSDYGEVAELVEQVETGKALSPDQVAFLRQQKDLNAATIDAVLSDEGAQDGEARNQLTGDLLDLHGPGRVIFRNTRAAMTGFPKRRVHLVPLQAEDRHAEWVDRFSTEFAVDAGDQTLELQNDLEGDPRVEWLAGLLRRLAPGKVLAICCTQAKATALDVALRARINVGAGVFHEGLTLLQRDRQAAWFAETEGAQLLICSEIGSEGRNFQFAHHLVLFDLPLNPELLEQRIGRLDRIGQTEDIHVHVPYLRGSPQEVLARWYHEGLDAFETNLEGGNALLYQFGRQVHDVAMEYPALEVQEQGEELSTLLRESARERRRLKERLEAGRDRLLERNSFRPAEAAVLVGTIRRADQDRRLEEYVLDVFEHFGVHVEELGPRTYHLSSHGVLTEAFPSVPQEGLLVTLDRQRALGREDVGFLSWDHPLVTGAMDLLLSGGKGNSSFAVWPQSQGRTLLLETWFVVETVAEVGLHLDRYLPPTPVRVVVDHQALEVSQEVPIESLEHELKVGNPYKLLDNAEIRQTMLPAMFRAARQSGEQQMKNVVNESLRAMHGLMDHEIDRLERLKRVNDHIRADEIEVARRHRHDLEEAISNARLRLDAVRLIWKGAPEVLGG